MEKYCIGIESFNFPFSNSIFFLKIKILLYFLTAPLFLCYSKNDGPPSIFNRFHVVLPLFKQILEYGKLPSNDVIN